MLKFFFNRIVIILTLLAVGLLLAALMIYNSTSFDRNSYDSPKFRTTLGPKPKRARKKVLSCFVAFFKNDSKLRLSGSGIPHLTDLDTIKSIHTGPVYVVNLIPNDVAYVDRLPRTYFGVYGSKDKLYYSSQRTEKKRQVLKRRRSKNNLPPQPENKPLNLKAVLDESRITLESELLAEKGIKYVSFPLQGKHFVNDWSFVQGLMNLIDTLPKDAWVHFHCDHGAGRTTTVMALYDIYKNKQGGTADEVLIKHHCLGGENLRNTIAHAGGTWTHELLDHRYTLVQAFHDYMNSPEGHPHISWLEWIKRYPEEIRGSLTET